VEAAGRTRVVIDLVRSSSYETRVDGNNLVVTVSNGVSGSASTTAMVGNDPTKSIAAGGTEISNVDFRRGKNGEGRIIVSFSNEGATADVKREGDRVLLDLYNAKLPANLAQRLDVLDFATPVQSIETRSRGNGAHLEIIAKAPFEQLAYQTGNEYVIEVAPKRVEEKKKSKDSEPEYTGARVTFNFQDIPTRSVLQLIADVSDLNIVVADSVRGNVTLRLVNVPWDQAMDLILQAKSLDKRRRGNVIWVAPQKEIADYEQAREDARIALEQRIELETAYIAISYGKAKDIAALLTDQSKQSKSTGAAVSTTGDTTRGFLSPRGSVTFDDRTNTLLVNDTPDKIKEVRELIATLDRPVQQVLIETRIVVATEDFARDLGVKFGISGGYEDRHNNVVTTSGSQTATSTMIDSAIANRLLGNRGLPVAVPNSTNRLNVNMPAVSPAGSFGLAILGADYRSGFQPARHHLQSAAGHHQAGPADRLCVRRCDRPAADRAVQGRGARVAGHAHHHQRRPRVPGLEREERRLGRQCGRARWRPGADHRQPRNQHLGVGGQRPDRGPGRYPGSDAQRYHQESAVPGRHSWCGRPLP